MMKQFRFLASLAIVLFLFSCNGNAQNTQSDKVNVANKIEVIDFHSTHRCETCNAIEANSKYTLETYFAEEVKNGKIIFKTVNVDKEENEKLAEKFEAAGTSLFLNVIKNGKETQIDLTDFAFLKGREQEGFSEELKNKIEQELKKL